uniref:Uncharacterized protein n=1 Tax=Theropithecus gelada TaxID=9565 RepID=A0A8D2FDP0_THEGE
MHTVGRQEGANHRNGVDWSEKQERTEKMVLEVGSREEIGGWSEAGREFPDLFRPNTVEARDRSAGPPNARLLVRFQYCQVTLPPPPSTLHSWEGSHYAQPTLKRCRVTLYLLKGSVATQIRNSST